MWVCRATVCERGRTAQILLQLEICPSDSPVFTMGMCFEDGIDPSQLSGSCVSYDDGKASLSDVFSGAIVCPSPGLMDPGSPEEELFERECRLQAPGPRMVPDHELTDSVPSKADRERRKPEVPPAPKFVAHSIPACGVTVDLLRLSDRVCQRVAGLSVPDDLRETLLEWCANFM